MTTFRKSSYSHNNGCVAVANLGQTVAVRNSIHPDRGTLTLPAPTVAAFVAACSASEFDDLAL